MKKIINKLAQHLFRSPVLWWCVARVVAHPSVTAYLIKRALRTPFTHIIKDGHVYMERYWLFNPYPTAKDQREDQFPISVRLHCIRQADHDAHLHDHPWDCRTIVLKGDYLEIRLEDDEINCYTREPGSTTTFGMDKFHKILIINPLPNERGVWTMFITNKYLGTWGYMVDGRKMSHKEYKK